MCGLLGNLLTESYSPSISRLAHSRLWIEYILPREANRREGKAFCRKTKSEKKMSFLSQRIIRGMTVCLSLYVYLS
jgi:hypothetical protein